jgi:hypothetical protein
MTAPVITLEKIAMTSPVFKDAALAPTLEQEWNLNRFEQVGYEAIANNHKAPHEMKILIDTWLSKKNNQLFAEAKEKIQFYEK